MKKFISMAMVAAMTTSMVPATAFAGDTVNATASVVNKWTRKDSDSTSIENIKTDDTVTKSAPELVLEITSASTQGTDPQKAYEFTVELEGATFDLDGDGKLEEEEVAEIEKGLTVELGREGTVGAVTEDDVDDDSYRYTKVSETELKRILGEMYDAFVEDDDEYTAPTDIVIAADADVKANNDGVKVEDGGEEEANPEDEVLGEKESVDFSAVTDPVVDDEAPAAATRKANLDALFEVYVAGLNAAAQEEDPDAEEVTVDAFTYGNKLGFDQKEGYVDEIGSFHSVKNIVDYILALEAEEDATPEEVEALAAMKATIKNGDVVATPATYTQTKSEWVAAALAELEGDLTSGQSFYKEETFKKGTHAAAGAARTNIVASVSSWKATNPEEITFVVETGDERLQKGDRVKFDIVSLLDHARDAYVSVRSDDFNISNNREDMLYVDIEDEGMTAYTKELTKVAEEEWTELAKDIEIKSVVGDLPAELELQVSNGFELRVNPKATLSGTGYTGLVNGNDDDEVIVKGVTGDKIVIDAEDLIIEATTADAGDIATLRITSPTNSEYGRFDLEVAEVVEYNVILSVEADKDVPVIYSGVDVDNYGITDDSDHFSLEITAEESFPGAWSMRQGFNFELPDGVYVTDVTVKDTKNFTTDNTVVGKAEWKDAFINAYKEGEHKNFEFDKRVFNDVDTTLAKEPAEVTFELQLVADPGFVGDVNLKLTGDLVDEQEVTIAKFATPYVVTAEQNDLKIDYRYTEIPTDIVVTETEAGLWDEEKATFAFGIEDELMHFEDDPTFTIDEASNLEIKNAEVAKFADVAGVITFTVDDESDEAATVTISDMELYMNRSIPAGPYDLEMATSMGIAYLAEDLFAPTADEATIEDVEDFSRVVKEAFVNIVTAGREQDDASFTTKVVVPVGESYIVAGENQYELDVPAYVSAAGYTMLPVRAVATALGINNNNVIWNGETKTVTILYGQRIITMVAGQKTVNVNGSVIPASAAVEIVDGRTFLPMRDLATALGVTDITWDAATKTATLNGGVVAE